MTPQQIEMALETIALVLEDLKKTQEKQQTIITAIKETLAEHAMRETQRLGQEIEQEPVAHCKVRPLRGDESFPKVEIDWVNQPVPGPLYTSPPQRTEQEPVGWPCLIHSADFSENTITLVMQCEDYKVTAGPHYLSLTPPQRKPLTDEELSDIWFKQSTDWMEFARAIEAAHGITGEHNGNV